MQKVLFSICAAFVIVSAAAQNVVYDAHADVRKVSSFNKVSISGALSVYLSQGKEQAVAVSSEDGKYNDKIKTEVRDGMLKVYVESGNWNKWSWGNKELKAYITITDIEMLNVSGASSVKLTDPITANDLKVEVTGASSIKGAGLNGNNINLHLTGASSVKIPIKGSSLDFHLTGASDADVDGSTTSLSVEATGASSFKGFDLSSTNCKVHATGASSISVTVSKELEAEATGASSVGYKGDAVITNLNVSGASSVKKKNG